MSNLSDKLQNIKPDPEILRHALLAAPLSIVLHEMGHAFTAFLLGYTDLYIAYHTWGGSAPIGITTIDRAWISAGGPIASFLIIILR